MEFQIALDRVYMQNILMYNKSMKYLIILAFLVVFIFLPLATDAQLFGGSQNLSIVLRCTCGPGYLAFMRGVPGTPTGLYYFGPTTRYWTGSGRPIAWNIIRYTPGVGICLMTATPACIPIYGHLVLQYGGSS